MGLIQHCIRMIAMEVILGARWKREREKKEGYCIGERKREGREKNKTEKYVRSGVAEGQQSQR